MPALTAAARYAVHRTGTLGSTQVLSREDGTIATQIRYDPYGAVRYRSGESGGSAPKYEFTGYESELPSKLAYAGARIYDPTMGSFLSHDPAAQSVSPYTYTDWDPVNRVDPDGAFWLLAPLIGFLAGFAITAIQAGLNGASPGEALKAGAVAGGIGALTGFLLGPVGAAAHGAGTAQFATFSALVLSAGAYGVAESFNSGQYFAGAVGAALLAYGIYAAYKQGQTIGATPSDPPASTSISNQSSAVSDQQYARRGAPLPSDREFWTFFRRHLDRPAKQAAKQTIFEQFAASGRAMARAQSQIPIGQQVEGLLLTSGPAAEPSFFALAVPATKADAPGLLQAINQRGFIARAAITLTGATEVTLTGTNPQLTAPSSAYIGPPSGNEGFVHLYQADGLENRILFP